jgi:hypothetical protein
VVWSLVCILEGLPWLLHPTPFENDVLHFVTGMWPSLLDSSRVLQGEPSSPVVKNPVWTLGSSHTCTFCPERLRRVLPLPRGGPRRFWPNGCGPFFVFLGQAPGSSHSSSSYSRLPSRLKDVFFSPQRLRTLRLRTVLLCLGQAPGSPHRCFFSPQRLA